MSENAKGKNGNTNKNTKRGYMIAIAVAAVIIIALLIIIIKMPKGGPSRPEPTEKVVILSPAATETQSTPEVTTAPTEVPTSVPTEVPTPVPTEVPTPTLEPTPDPTPTQAPPTVTPSPKPRIVDGKTSANPAYEGKRLVALTFDDGPQVGATEYMLDVLKKHGAKATFFCVGEQLEYGPAAELTKRAAQEGHQIANHSYSHPAFGKLTKEEILYQRDTNAQLIEKITGKAPTCFRVPGGGRGQTVRETIGQPIVMWDIDPLDWKFLTSSYIKSYAKEHGMSYDEAESRIIDIILFEGLHTDLDGDYIWSPPVAEEMKHGSILLFHDIYPASAKAVDRLLTYLEENYGNYVYLPFDDFILTENDTVIPGKVYLTLWRTYPSD